MNRQIFFYSLISIVSLGVILTCVYYWLGGFQEVKVYELQGQTKTIIGKSFTGRSNSKVVVDYLNECQQLVRDSTILGTVTRVVYKNDTLPSREAQYFIGIDIQEDEMVQAPLGFQIREFNSSKRFAIFLEMNRWVRPSPSTIDEMLSTTALERGFELGDKILEVYYIDDTMSVEGWVD